MRIQVEIEAKYDVAPDQALPDLIGVGGVDAMVAQAEMVLTATYLDTPGQALAAARTTLRRRTGGTDDGWHLKLSLADGDRLELQRALGRGSTPPAALTALVRGLVGTEPLAPIATLVNRRTVHRLLDAEGRLLAELADDSVVGERHDVDAAPTVWRELEIELVEGERDVLTALDSAVRAAGVRPASGPSKLARVLDSGGPADDAGPVPPFRRRSAVGVVTAAGLHAAVREVRAADPLVRLDRAGALPRLEAAVRGARAAVAVQEQLVPAEASADAATGLGWLLDELAPLAEVDASWGRIRSAVDSEPADLVLGPVVRRVDRELAAARRPAVKALRATLDSPRYLAVLDTLARLEAGLVDAPGADRRVGDVLPALVEREVARAEERIARVRRGAAPEERAALVERALLAADRARHAEQLAATTKSWGRRGLVEAFGAAAEVLRDLQTSVATQARLRDLAAQAGTAGDSAFTFGRLHGREDLVAADLTRRLRRLRKTIVRLAAE